jgi:hypothetical protein
MRPSAPRQSSAASQRVVRLRQPAHELQLEKVRGEISGHVDDAAMVNV